MTLKVCKEKLILKLKPKNKYSRWENVSQVFELTNKKRLNNKHLLIVDDVVTTGSTLESCIETLQQIEGIKVSIVTIAIS